MSWEWNYGSSPAYNFSNRKKLSGEASRLYAWWMAAI
jgi:hypothetical protein